MPDWCWLMLWLWTGSLPILAATIGGFYLYYRLRYVGKIARMFEERPIFVIPRGKPVAGAEDVSVRTADGLTLRGCYLPTPAASRRGVVLFGLEYGSDRWSAESYCGRLLAAGYDVFACEPRNQGQSDKDAGYEPLHWSTDRDLADLRAAADYLHDRPDADPAGIGVFGVSKGGSLALLLAAADRKVRCVATDGAFAAYTTMVPFMRRWVGTVIKSRTKDRPWVPDWFYGLLGLAAIARVEKRRGVTFVGVEKAARRVRQPLLMIHGGADSYIKPEMAAALFEQTKRSRARELWVVPGAKHNQAIQAAGGEYHARLVGFFDAHLGRFAAAADPMAETVPADGPELAEALADLKQR